MSFGMLVCSYEHRDSGDDDAHVCVRRTEPRILSQAKPLSVCQPNHFQHNPFEQHLMHQGPPITAQRTHIVYGVRAPGRAIRQLGLSATICASLQSKCWTVRLRWQRTCCSQLCVHVYVKQLCVSDLLWFPHHEELVSVFSLNVSGVTVKYVFTPAQYRALKWAHGSSLNLSRLNKDPSWNQQGLESVHLQFILNLMRSELGSVVLLHCVSHLGHERPQTHLKGSIFSWKLL